MSTEFENPNSHNRLSEDAQKGLGDELFWYSYG
jgi:hypothetical protein